METDMPEAMHISILFLLPKNAASQSLQSVCRANALHPVLVHTAEDALEQANSHRPDCVVMELSLAGHSGLEFLYEFRSYADWDSVPIIVYSTVRLEDKVLQSSAWKNLAVSAYYYAPTTPINTMLEQVKELSSRGTA